MSPDDIDTRLAALEARAPVRDDPPELPRPGRRRRLARPVALAAVLVLAVVASATAGGAVVATLFGFRATPGVQNPGQPLEGAKLECMSPRQAAAYLAEHGFTDVVWQVETGIVGFRPGAAGTSVQKSSPPAHGYVVPGSILSDGKLYMIVDQRVGSTGGGACPDLPMP